MSPYGAEGTSCPSLAPCLGHGECPLKVFRRFLDWSPRELQYGVLPAGDVSRPNCTQLPEGPWVFISFGGREGRCGEDGLCLWSRKRWFLARKEGSIRLSCVCACLGPRPKLTLSWEFYKCASPFHNSDASVDHPRFAGKEIEAQRSSLLA